MEGIPEQPELLETEIGCCLHSASLPPLLHPPGERPLSSTWLPGSKEEDRASVVSKENINNHSHAYTNSTIKTQRSP